MFLAIRRMLISARLQKTCKRPSIQLFLKDFREPSPCIPLFTSTEALFIVWLSSRKCGYIVNTYVIHVLWGTPTSDSSRMEFP